MYEDLEWDFERRGYWIRSMFRPQHHELFLDSCAMLKVAYE